MTNMIPLTTSSESSTLGDVEHFSDINFSEWGFTNGPQNKIFEDGDGNSTNTTPVKTPTPTPADKASSSSSPPVNDKPTPTPTPGTPQNENPSNGGNSGNIPSSS